jgi:hypothetical protein
VVIQARLFSLVGRLSTDNGQSRIHFLKSPDVQFGGAPRVFPGHGRVIYSWRNN